MEQHEIRRMKLADLRPADYNPRKITDTAFEGLGQSIGKFGMMIPIIWNERTGNIVGGHQRYKHLTESGEDEVDVVVVSLDDQEEVALNIVLNNKFVRGKFTKDVVGLLERVEVQIGSAFNDIGLSDLHNYVKRLKFEIDEGEDDGKGKDREPGEPGDPGEPGEPGDQVNGDPNAVIQCPRCHSAWRMDNNEVLHNAIGE
jgi:hypothetical protein